LGVSWSAGAALPNTTGITQIIQFGTSPLNWIASSTGEVTSSLAIVAVTNDGGTTWGSIDGTLRSQIIEASGNPSYNPNISQMEIVIKPWVAA
jgi:hypothetical protein